ncbi:Uu.00g023430.m01.CDS01 [Anthostomella pinea]|uniref:Uu.00g023430.m01.CDS01 n=1 Tax=Anthostomella pinea TaxID=933095 RepID=A0AAI8YQX9_9PEZI|nr:Uu.00g023430.m01.CDS01 [Anthostomella pinea]
MKFSNNLPFVAFFIIILLLLTLKTFFGHSQYYQDGLQPPIDKTIPRKIWYKLGPRGLSADAKEWADSCTTKNPGYATEYISDDYADEWVARNFSHRPDVVGSYLNTTIPILKADLLRYLLLYQDGGAYFDLDVECGHGGIDDWIPPHLRHNTSLVVGWEMDAGLTGDVSHQLASWTIMARKGTPYMMAAIDDISRAIHDESNEHSVPVSDLKLWMLPDVVDFTGPARLTRSVFKGLEQTLGRDVDRRLVQGILEPTQMGDVLFMPGWAFAAGQGQYPEEDRDKIGPRLVIHH